MSILNFSGILIFLRLKNRVEADVFFSFATLCFWFENSFNRQAYVFIVENI